MHPVPFEQAFERQTPAPLAIAIARDPAGKYNPITLAWFTRVSKEPPMMAIAIGRDKYSLSAIRHAGAFVLAIPIEQLAKETFLFGTVSGRDAEKLKQSGLRTLGATAIDSVLLADAVANYECVVKSEIETGDHFLFTGEVLAAHVNDDSSLRPLFSDQLAVIS